MDCVHLQVVEDMIQATWHGKGVDYRQLLRGMLSFDPAQRPTVNMALDELEIACAAAR